MVPQIDEKNINYLEDGVRESGLVYEEKTKLDIPHPPFRKMDSRWIKDLRFKGRKEKVGDYLYKCAVGISFIKQDCKA